VKNYKDGKLLIVDVDNLDFINKEADMNHIVNQVKEKLGI
jgi:deoxyadenosine/deoxycytidine kinase